MSAPTIHIAIHVGADPKPLEKNRYRCPWCGITRPAHRQRAQTSCTDCKPTENAFTPKAMVNEPCINGNHATCSGRNDWIPWYQPDTAPLCACGCHPQGESQP